MDEWFRDFYSKNFNYRTPMRVRFLNLCTLGGTIGSFFATLVSLISGVNSSQGLMVSLFSILFYFVLFILTQTTKKYDLCIILGICATNFLIFPLLYFTMGGLKGGMVLYFLMGIIFSLLLMNFKQSLIVLPLELLSYISIVILGEHHPEFFTNIPYLDERYVLDTSLDFIVIAFTTMLLIRFLYIAYDKEQARAETLVTELEALSVTDSLTNVRNRAFFIQAVETEMNKAKRLKTDLSVVFLEIDDFKNINYKYGHVVGDEILKSFAKLLLSRCRDYDIIARYTNEKFAILLPQANLEIAQKKSEEIKKAMGVTNLHPKIQLNLTVSIGVATFDPSMPTVESFLEKANDMIKEDKKRIK